MTRTEIAPLVLTKEQMNLLQDAGLISDNCVTQDDIAPQDWERVREWLEKQRLNDSPVCGAAGGARSDFPPPVNVETAQSVL